MSTKLVAIVLLGGLLLAALVSIGLLLVQGVRSLNDTPKKGSYVLYEERPAYAQLIDVRQWDWAA